jgi:flagellar hook assembly protein FlgD
LIHGGCRVLVAEVADSQDFAAGRILVTADINPRTRIEYTVPRKSTVELAVYDVGGRRVRTLVEATLNAGQHLAVWDGTDGSGKEVPSGVYFYRLSVGGLEAKQRMVLLR